VDLTAPGGVKDTPIFSTCPLARNLNGQLEDLCPYGYGYGYGTSQAAAHVTGALALKLQQNLQQNLPISLSQVQGLLCQTATILPDPEGVPFSAWQQGDGLINVECLLNPTSTQCPLSRSECPPQ